MPERAHNDKLRRTLSSLVMAIGAVIVLVQWISTMLKPHGDFSRHWEFGRRFVHGEFLYNGGLNIPYPPFFAMAYAPLSFLPLRVAKPVLFLFGFGALFVVFWILNRLTDRSLVIRRGDWLWVIAGTLLCSARFVLRDFDDGGQNLILVGLTWIAIYLWSRNRDLLAAISLGLAVALKCTPALFIVYFAWKRQWKISGLALLMAGVFTLLPAVWQTSSYPFHMRVWTENILRGFSEHDPSVGILGAEQVQNKSLRPVLARYLMHLPPGHPGRIEDGGYVDFFALSPQAAGLVINAVLLLGLITIGWLFRKRASPADPAIPWECAAISLLMLLYSPITWGQHCVAVIPALYLIIRSFLSGCKSPLWTLCLLGIIAFFLVIENRSIVGRDLSLLLESYHLVTWFLVALLGVLLSERSRLFNTRSTSPARSC